MNEPDVARACHVRFGPVFVLGHARSGTRLVSRLLHEHFDIHFGAPSGFFVRFHGRLPRYGDLTRDASLSLLLRDLAKERFFTSLTHDGAAFDLERVARSAPQRTYPTIIRALFDQLAASRTFSRWGDATPEYCRDIAIVHRMFPDAQFVHVVRDGRDVARSIFQAGLGPRNTYEVAVNWKRTIASVRRCVELLPAGTVTEARYEELLTDPATTLSKLATHLGVVARPDAIAAAAVDVRRQVGNRGVQRWREHLSWREIECFETYAGDELRVCGYTPQFRPRTGTQSAAETAYWRMHALIARASWVAHSARRRFHNA